MEKEENVHTLKRAGTIAKINLENAQVFSLVRRDPQTNKKISVWWGGGAPNAVVLEGEWPNSTMFMVPWGGPAPNDVIFDKEEVIPATQHGMSRWYKDFPWRVVEKSSSSITLEQDYEANKKALSSNKKNEKDEVIIPRWPWKYKLIVTYGINEKGEFYSEMRIRNLSDTSMPVSPGFHHTFNAVDKSVINVFNKEKLIESLNLKDIGKGSTHHTDKSDRIEYITPDYSMSIGHNLTIFWVWRTKGGRAVAFEPVLTDGISKPNSDISSQPGFILIPPGEESMTFRTVVRIRK